MRKTAVLSFSVPPRLARDYERLAAEGNKSKSELFREMVDAYRQRRDEQELYRLQRRMRRTAGKGRPLTEREVERIVFEER